MEAFPKLGWVDRWMDWVSLGANWMEQLAALITLFHCAYITLLYMHIAQ